jgi:hypothetical protein
MKYRTILLLNIISLIEAVLIKLAIDHDLIVCNIQSSTSLYGIISFVAVKNILVLGGYQMYFWPQRNIKHQRRRYLPATLLDKRIPAVPELFWIYSPLYYIFFSLALLCLRTVYASALNGWIMLLHGSFWFFYFPTSIEAKFRDQIIKVSTDKVTKFIMNMVHVHDSEDNACPSMHCAFAVFLACIAYPFYPTFSIVFPILVSLSCLLTKQHLILDIIPGFLLGGLHGFINVVFLEN